MVKSLKIYTESNNFKIGIEYLILYALFISLISIYTSNNYYYNNLNETLTTLGILLVLITFVYFVILIFANLFRYEKVNGDLSDDLIFDTHKITAGDATYYLLDIEGVIIENSDIKGSVINSTFAFRPHRSNGLKNYVELYLKDGTNIKYNFLQSDSDKIKIFDCELITYYKERKIGWQNLLNCLEIDGYDNIQEFKRTFRL